MAEKYILEFDRNQIEFIAAMTHLYLSRHDGDEVAVGTLDALISQTNYVYSDPLRHGISTTPLTPMNKTTATMWGQKISGFFGDLVDLSGMIIYTDDF